MLSDSSNPVPQCIDIIDRCLPTYVRSTVSEGREFGKLLIISCHDDFCECPCRHCVLDQPKLISGELFMQTLNDPWRIIQGE